MKIVCVGGGPAGLYFALLMKKTFPGDSITVIERNQPDDTFGWGVVFSSGTLSGLREADAESYAAIRESFRYWDNIDTFFRGERITSTGHGFCGLSRRRLLNILQERCRALGVELRFGEEVASSALLSDHDLIVAADGIASRIREEHAAHFRPSLDFRKCRFTWLGATLPLEAFTFIYRENEHGLFQVHAYPFEEGLSTFIVECHRDVFERAGLDKADEDQTIAYCERLFAEDLRGHRLLKNRSIWRSFPTVRNATWHHENIVLIGDAAHTAHFSIGSGTKLAMEDAIALRDAWLRHRGAPVSEVLSAYEESRRADVSRLQRAAQTSLEWFENTARYMNQHPIEFTFNQLTRSQRITWDNLTLRDPEFMTRVRQHFARDLPRTSTGGVPVPMFTPYRLRELRLENRVVVSPMCMYSAKDGLVDDFHLVHLGSRAVGGAGLVLSEMTAVSREARISPGCAGMYLPEHVPAWRRIVEFVHQHTRARIGLQLGHAGRKGSTRPPFEGMDQPLPDGNWPLLSASPRPYMPSGQVPAEMDRADMDRVRADYVRAAHMALAAGFDMLELHMAHGYLLASFISPLTNLRTDAYGGAIASRMRFPLEIFAAVRALWPAERPISVRISASDWVDPGGLTPEDAVEAARLLYEAGCDIIDVSAGQTVPEGQPPHGRMFQVPLSDLIRNSLGRPTMTVGGIRNGDHMNTILAAGRADLCVLARAHLLDPYLTLHEAERYEYPDIYWPPQYLRGKPVQREGARTTRAI